MHVRSIMYEHVLRTHFGSSSPFAAATLPASILRPGKRGVWPGCHILPVSGVMPTAVHFPGGGMRGS